MGDEVYTEEFRPLLKPGDLFAMIGASGLKTAKAGGSGIYVCTGWQGFMSLSQHGVLVIWADSGSAPTGYLADGGMQSTTNHLTSGQQYEYPLQNLVFSKGQLAQLRFRLKFFATVTGVVDDYDVTLFSPPAIQLGKFAHIASVINTIDQVQDPSDVIVSPAQGANQTLPAVFPLTPPLDFALRTQALLLEDASLGVGVLNNGSGTTSGGALGLKIGGFVFNFSPVESFEGIQFGAARQLIPGISKVPIPVGYDINAIKLLQVEARTAN